MESTRLSSKGQVIIPKAVRASRGWKPGLRLAVEETEDGILLRPARPFAETHVDDVLGCVRYSGPARSLEEMDEAIATGVRQVRR
jgi:AbrB family looped-hinge helix DNA binding protein